MGKLPEKVHDTLSKLRQESPPPPYLVVRKIHGKYYVYKDSVSQSTGKNKRKITSEYIGKITDDGTFIKRSISAKDDVENAKSIILSHGGKVFFPENVEGKEPVEVLTPDEIDSKILTILSMNGRASIPFISKRVHLSISAVDNRIKKLERELGIRYIIEPDIEKLGYLSYITFVKFIDKKPEEHVIREALTKESLVQLAVLTKGEYDLVFYVLAKNNENIAFLMARLQNTSALNLYKSEWYTTPDRTTYNFIPLRDEFFEELKSNVWTRSKETPRPLPENLLSRELIVLEELNKDANIKFEEIDIKYKLHPGSSAYTYHKLVEKGIIKRITINMENFPMKYPAVVQVKVLSGAEYSKTRPNLPLDIIEYQPNGFNKYLFTSDIEMPKGGLLITPIFKEGDLQKTTEKLVQKVNGIEIETMIITDFITGSFCYRRFDNEYSKQYKALRDQYKLPGFKKESEVTRYQ